MESLVIQTSFIGDVILTTPLIRELAQKGVVDVITTPVGATVLRNNPQIRHLMVYDKRKEHAGVGGLLRFRASAIGGRYQDKSEPSSAYLAQGSVRSAALAATLGCKTRIGFASSAGRLFYTHRVTYRDDWHHARRLVSLASYHAAEAGEIDIQPRVYPGLDEVTAVDALLQGRSREIVAFAPGSVWATKRWPYYRDLAQLVTHDWDIALIGGNDDRAAAQDIIELVGADRVIDAIGRLSLLGSAELIRRSRAIVTNDSSPQHLASAVGTPTVTIFGPTVPAFGFGPLAPLSRVIGRDDLLCRPCDRHGPQRCPLGHWHCMRDVTPPQVYEVLGTVMRIRDE